MTEPRPTTEIFTAEGSVEVLKDQPSGKGARRFDMLAYTGTPVARSYGLFVIDLKGINLRSKIPMLVDHNGTKIAGFADKCLITDRGLELSGVLSKTTEYGRMVAGLCDEGFPWQASVGIDNIVREEIGEGEICEVNGLTLAGPVSIARSCDLPETSFLYQGADTATYAVALSSFTTEQEAQHVADTPKAAVADPREALTAFRAQFPGQEELATQGYLAGKSVTDVKLDLAAKDREALTAARAELETLSGKLKAATEELATIKSLETQAGNPGIGFDGQSRQVTNGETLAPTPVDLPKTPKEAWDSSEKLQAEFPRLSSYEALCRREGFNPKDGI